ncbi:10441_t:CDS:2, partial [Cetraspora pellucida]
HKAISGMVFIALKQKDREIGIQQNASTAIIYGCLPFRFVENLYLHEFLQKLNPTYHLPFCDMIKGCLLTKMFSNHVQEKLNTFSTFIDFIISLNEWTDNSRNSIFGFMAFKESQEIVLDILDLFVNHHTRSFIKTKVEEVLTVNGIQMSSAIACITDNPSNIDKMRVTAYKKGFRCCLMLSETECPKYPEIKNVTVKNIICDRYHFADNEVLTEVIRPVIDAIGRLESNDSTLADIFKELIHIH